MIMTPVNEQNAHELNWSRSIPTSRKQIERWFGLELKETGGNDDQNSCLGCFYILFIIYLILNFPAWLAMNDDALVTSLVISGIILTALYRIGKRADGGGTDE